VLVNGKIAVEDGIPSKELGIEKGYGTFLECQLKNTKYADCEPDSFGQTFSRRRNSTPIC
jgi:hypothetical protein